MSNEDQWHKCLVLVMKQLGIVEMLITPQTIESMIEVGPDNQVCAIVDHYDDGIKIKVSTVKEAKEYAGIPNIARIS